MGIYDKYADAPDQIKTEGQEITLKFQRTSDTTGRLSWNIPAPAAGCKSDSQAYNGFLVTVSSKPANYLSTSPVDGNFYTADPSVDSDLHAGDKLDGALIVGAFYDDKLTTYLDVVDLQPRTAYYFSGYAVDKVARYHREGVHAYSLPAGVSEMNDEEDLPAIQDIAIDHAGGISPITLTGLDQDAKYAMSFIIDNKLHKLIIDGAQALDYDDFVYHINQEFIRLTPDKYEGPFPPHANRYYVDVEANKVYTFDGYTLTLVNAMFVPYDPSDAPAGSLWYNPETDTLSVYDAGWIDTPYISSTFDFANPKCYQFWFDGENVYKWEKVVWRQLPTYLTETNPLSPPTLDCNTFWYDTSSLLLNQWDSQLQKWIAVNAIYSETDPNTIASGTLWYNQIDGKLYYFAGSAWNALNNVSYSEPDAQGNFVGTPTANLYWFVPSQQQLYRRDVTNTSWVELDLVLFTSDPRDRESCQLWWDSDADILYTWDIVNLQWVEVSSFTQSDLDPSKAVDIPLGSAWYNPTTDILTIINNPDCSVVNFIQRDSDPMVIDIGTYWYNPETNVWSIWNGSGWNEVEVLVKTDDPYVMIQGELWFNPASTSLYSWDSVNSLWIEEEFSEDPFEHAIGQLWFNPTSGVLYEWNGTTWVETIGIAAAKLILLEDFPCDDCQGTHYSRYNYDDGRELPYEKDILRIYTKKKGCKVRIELCISDSSYTTDFPHPLPASGNAFVFANLTQGVMYFDAKKGYSALESAPMYQQIGVGTDGSPDERRKLDAIIRSALGDPSAKVELTKEQIDICISNALKELRKRSNLSVSRQMFFLDVNPRQQTYLLKDKCVGFNKIVDINAIYRTRAGFFGLAGTGGDNLFGYAALQQLYRLGTFDMLSFHLVASYMEELQTLFAEHIMFQWVERPRELKVYQAFYARERVLVDAVIERTEQDLLTHRDTTLWLQKYAIADAKQMLAQVRGKFVTLPGPNGNTTLNAQDLISQAEQEKATLLEEISDLMMQDANDIGMRTHFIIG